MAFLRQHSKNLYVFDDVYSSLQKEIRLGNVHEALFWGGEFVVTGNPNPLWNRLFVIMAEDISVGQPTTARVLWQLYHDWKQQLAISGISEKESYRSISAGEKIISAIRYLTQSYKNRMVCNLVGYVSTSIPMTDLELTTSSSSQHCLYRALFSYIEKKETVKAVYCLDLILLKPSLGNPDPSLISWSERCSASTQDLVKVLVMINQSKLGSRRLNCAYMVVAIIHDSDLIWDQPLHWSPGSTQLQAEWFYHSYDQEDLFVRRKLTVPEYALDKHTSRGKGSKKLADNFHLLVKIGNQRGLDINKWSMIEKSKSHGTYKQFLEAYSPVNSNAHSRLSHFFLVGARISPIRTGWSGQDPYFSLTMNAYLKIERDQGYRAAKSTQILKKLELQLDHYLNKMSQSQVTIRPKVQLRNPKLKVVMRSPPKLHVAIKSKQTVTESPQTMTESSRFQFLVRAQIVTSASKTDTYYAIDKSTNERVFVKGPFLPGHKSQPEAALISMNLKRLLGLNYIPIQIVNLVPDGLITPLGTRNSILPGQMYKYLVMDNLLEEPIHRTLHEATKCWPITEVVDWVRMLAESPTRPFKISLCNDERLIRQYIELIIYRYIAGIGDLAERNTLISKGRVYLFDEDSMGNAMRLSTQFKGDQIRKIVEYVRNNHDYFIQLIEKWKIIFCLPEFQEWAGVHWININHKLQELDIIKMWTLETKQ